MTTTAKSYKPTVALDFDGTINSYTSGWTGAANLPDTPTDGAKEAVAELRETYLVAVFSSRCATVEGVQAVGEWLNKHGIVVDTITAEKPPAVCIVADRALRFDGDWDKVLDGHPGG